MPADKAAIRMSVARSANGGLSTRRACWSGALRWWSAPLRSVGGGRSASRSAGGSGHGCMVQAAGDAQRRAGIPDRGRLFKGAFRKRAAKAVDPFGCRLRAPPMEGSPVSAIRRARGTSLCPGHILLFGHVKILFLSLLSKSLPIKGREARPGRERGKGEFLVWTRAASLDEKARQLFGHSQRVESR